MRLGIGEAVLWVLLYLGFMLLYTALNTVVWRKCFPKHAPLLHVITMGVCAGGFLALLYRAGYRVELLANLSFGGMALAIGCSALFFLVLDKGLDPVLEGLFPQSEQSYQEAAGRLAAAPAAGLLQVCVLAPVMEEILMRGLVLGGLKNSYGTLAALLISALLFAALHFNMVQTLSAFVCGVVLGVLYLKTGSLLCCMAAHCGYNAISYFVIMRKMENGTQGNGED